MRRILGATVLLLGGLACTAEPVSPTSSGEELIELGLTVDGVVGEAVWRRAPAGCEGRLDAGEVGRVAWAENAPGLGVVLDEEGDPLCVDTLESIAIEVEKLEGDPSPDPMHPTMVHGGP